MKKTIIFTLNLIFIWLAPTLTLADPTSTIDKNYYNCLVWTAGLNRTQYSSFDGKKSILRLMAACEEEWKAYVNACIKSGEDDGDCTLRSGILAQATLKLLGI